MFGDGRARQLHNNQDQTGAQQIVCVLRCHLDGEWSNNVFIMKPIPAHPHCRPHLLVPSQGSGMLGFHDADQVKTWQCGAGWPGLQIHAPASSSSSSGLVADRSLSLYISQAWRGCQNIRIYDVLLFFYQKFNGEANFSFWHTNCNKVNKISFVCIILLYRCCKMWLLSHLFNGCFFCLLLLVYFLRANLSDLFWILPTWKMCLID